MDTKGFSITSTRTYNNNLQFLNSDAWQVRIKNPRGKTFSTKYYMGYGYHGKKPSLKQVLESLILEANVAYDIPEDEFIEDLYPDNPELGAKLYKQCGKIADRLENFLTHDERQFFEDN